MPTVPRSRNLLSDSVRAVLASESSLPLCLAIVCSGCGSEGPGSRRSNAVVVDSLRAELLARHPAIGLPTVIQPAKHLLWVADASGDPFLHLLDAVTGERIKSFGRSGEGPAEFVGPVWRIQVVTPDTAAVWVYDAGGDKFVWIDESATLSPASPTFKPRDVTYLWQAFWLDSLTIMNVTLSEDDHFLFFDRAGHRTETVPGALLGADSLPLAERQRATSASGICVHPDGFGFAQYYFAAGRLELYERDAGGPLLADVPYPSEPIFARVQGRIRFREERIHYVGCASSTDRLFLLYSGQPEEAETSSHGREIHLFDWEGRLVRVSHLDVFVGDLGIDEEGGWLYATSYLDAGVYRFRLPTGTVP